MGDTEPHHILAVEGTIFKKERWRDIVHNGEIILGGVPDFKDLLYGARGVPEFKELKERIRNALQKLKNRVKCIAITGHSLGAIKALAVAKDLIDNNKVGVSGIYVFNPHVPRDTGSGDYRDLVDELSGKLCAERAHAHTHANELLIFAHQCDIASCPLEGTADDPIQSHIRFSLDGLTKPCTDCVNCNGWKTALWSCPETEGCRGIGRVPNSTMKELNSSWSFQNLITWVDQNFGFQYHKIQFWTRKDDHK